jgi:hypothetical protein
MDENSAIQLLNETNEFYTHLKIPKYKQIPLKQWQEYLDQLQIIKQFMGGDKTLQNLINAISQIVSKLEKLENVRPINKVTKAENPDRNILMNTTERSVNKTIPCTRGVLFPFSWKDESNGRKGTILNGSWDSSNSMLLDMLATIFLMKEGGDLIPKEQDPIFDTLDHISNKEDVVKKKGPENNTDLSIELIKRRKYYFHFTDKDFRLYTSRKMKSNEILDLLLRTYKMEFKLVFPVRLIRDNKSKEHTYEMNLFSKLFDLGYIDIDIRESDNAVLCREYHISFDTILGEMFVHNLKTKNYDWVHRDFYHLPETAQFFYRRFILNHTRTSGQIGLDKIAYWLNLKDTNINNLVSTVESSVFEILLQCKFISKYRKIDGQNGVKFYYEVDR